MRENLEYMISAINAATISAVAHRSNGLIDNNYDRARKKLSFILGLYVNV